MNLFWAEKQPYNHFLHGWRYGWGVRKRMGYRDRDWEWGWAGETTPASALLAEHLSVPSKEFECRSEAWDRRKETGTGVVPQFSLLCEM